MGHPAAFIIAALVIGIWGIYRPDIQVQRHLAISHQHRHDDRHIPDGFFDSEHSES